MKHKKYSMTLAGPRWDALTVILFAVFLFFAMHILTERASVWFAFIALAVCVGRTPWRLGRQRFCVPVLGFLAFMVVYGLSAVWSPFGGTAAREFSWMLTAFAAAAPVLFRLEKRHVRGLLWGLAAVSAVISLLCTDLACEGPLSEAFIALTERFGSGVVYAEGIEDTVGRVNGIYNDANVTGSLFALGALVSLYLVQTGEKWWKRLLACVLVSTSAVGILLSVSRGAMLCFGLALLAWLAAAGKGQRLRLFLLMVISAGVCFAAFAPATLMIAPGAMLPNLLAAGSGVVIFLLDWAVGERLARLLGGHWKIMSAAAIAAAVAVGVFAVAALTMTEPHVFQTAETIRRSANLPAGEYSLSAEGDFGEACRVSIYKTSDIEAVTGTRTGLYNGPIEDAAFVVPEDSDRVFFSISGEEGDVLRSVTLSDGTEIPLDYVLLPEVIVSRLHRGMLSDNSFLLRVQFMKDAWVLFKQSPLIGHGLGSTDNLYPAVQPYYYQSRYVHNHVLQVMADQGLLGAVPFMVFLCGVLWLLVKRLRKGADPLAAVLLACWVMMNSHGMMEINFSLQPYQCFAFVLLLLPVVLYGVPLAEQAAKAGGAAVCAVFWAFLAVFGGLMGLRQTVRRESDTLRATSVEQLMSALESYARRDVFDPAPYELEYVATAVTDTSGQYGLQMMQYVEKIRNSGNYPANSALLGYYYLPAGDFQGLFACSRESLRQRASYATVWNGQAEFYRDQVLPAAGESRADVVLEGVLAFRDLLEEVNRDRLGKIVLTAENQAFVDLAVSAESRGLSGGALYQYLTSGGEEEPAV